MAQPRRCGLALALLACHCHFAMDRPRPDATTAETDAQAADLDDAQLADTPIMNPDGDVGTVQVFRSVGTRTANLNTSGRTVGIAARRALFSGALPDTVGVGDVLQYEVEGSWNLAFVTSRASSTELVVASADGGDPRRCEPGTAVEVLRAYASLASWAEREPSASIQQSVADFDSSGDLVASERIMNVACYGDGADTDRVQIRGWTTSAAYYIRIFTPHRPTEVGKSQRHDGKWTDGAYHLDYTASSGSDHLIDVEVSHLRLEGLQLSVTTNGGYVAAVRHEASSGELRLSHSIIRGVAMSDTDEFNGLKSSYDDSAETPPVLKIWNNVFYDFAFPLSTTVHAAIFINRDSTTGYVYNNTVVNCGSGVIGRLANIALKNNIAKDCGETYNSWNGDNAASDWNVSNANSDGFPGSHSINGGFDGSVAFVDEQGRDLHLSDSDVVAANKGIDLSADAALSFDDDVDADTRPAGSGWDIGADER